MVEFLKLGEAERWLVVKNKLSEGFKKSQVANLLQVANSTISASVKWGKTHDPAITHSYEYANRSFGKIVRKHRNKDAFEKEVISNLSEMFVDAPPQRIRTEIKKAGGGEILATMSDLHGGAETKGLRGTLDYDLSIMKRELEDLKQEINKEQADKVNLFILGDLIESFMGNNHPNAWESLEPGMYGAQIIFVMRDILSDFIAGINNIVFVGCVTGNHDRCSASNKVDVDGQIGKTIYRLLDETFPDIKFKIDDHIVELSMGGVTHIGLHGHTGSAKKMKGKMEPKALSVANQYIRGDNGFVVVYTGHLHEHKIYKETCRYVCMCVPAIFTGNGYSEKGGWSGLPGAIITKCKNGYPSFNRVTLA